MPILNIIEYPDPALRQQASPVSEFDSQLAALVNDLTQTLHSTSGIGLSAPQVARSLQIMVMDLSDNQSRTEVLINPQIINKAGLAIIEESCLSIPGVSAKVMRASVVRVRFQDLTGSTEERDFEGMQAVCIQHEIDHLQGVLFFDRISRLRRYRLRHVLRSLEHNTTSSAAQAV